MSAIAGTSKPAGEYSRRPQRLSGRSQEQAPEDTLLAQDTRDLRD